MDDERLSAVVGGESHHVDIVLSQFGLIDLRELVACTVGEITCPVTTWKLQISVCVPLRLYSNSLLAF